MANHQRERLKKFTHKGQTYRWRVSTLWNAVNDRKAIERHVHEFDEQLDHDRWFREYSQPTVNNVVFHCKRINSADLSYPIILWENKFVLDGMHRLAKAKMLGEEKILTVNLISLPESDFNNDLPFYE